MLRAIKSLKSGNKLTLYLWALRSIGPKRPRVRAIYIVMAYSTWPPSKEDRREAHADCNDALRIASARARNKGSSHDGSRGKRQF
jgi:hypothetical protein